MVLVIRDAVTQLFGFCKALSCNIVSVYNNIYMCDDAMSTSHYMLYVMLFVEKGVHY